MEKRRHERLDGKPIKVFQIEKKKWSENWNEVYYVCVTNNFYKVLAIRVKMKLRRYIATRYEKNAFKKSSM